MISVRTEASMDYFETDSNSSAPKRVPLSLRLPVQVVESVDPVSYTHLTLPTIA